MKKLISLLLVLCMVLGMNVSAWAAGDCTANCTCGCWNGTSDTSWYNDTDTEFTLKTGAQLAGLAELVDGGNTFAGKTIKLGNDINLNHIHVVTDENGDPKKDTDGNEITEPTSFDPIGDDSPFAGTFDGQGHTISDLYQSGWAFGYEWGSYGSIGLFGELESATVKNLTIDSAYAVIEGGDIGGIGGSATGTCTFENIKISNSGFGTYNNGLGGIIGWSGAGNYTFKNITITADTVLGGLWGSFDSSIGGVVGQAEPGATYNFENVDISCRIDAYNDCTASYDYYLYRMCGMMIGRCAETTTIDGTNYPDTSKYNITCSNVTVNYGDWMNYHYCEPTPGHNNGRGMRVEAGFEYGGLPADFDHTQCTTNHMALIPFDQIIGGAQYGVKGLKTYDGVTVNYNGPSKQYTGTNSALPSCCVNGTCCGTPTTPETPIVPDDTDDNWYYEEIEEDEDTESLVVRIKFDGVDEADFEEIKVNLLRNGKKYESEELSASKVSKKDWRFEWDNLDEDYEWSVELTAELEGYEAEIVNLRGNYWTITLTSAEEEAPVVSVDKANPETGASDFVSVAVALAAASVLGGAALSLKK